MLDALLTIVHTKYLYHPNRSRVWPSLTPLRKTKMFRKCFRPYIFLYSTMNHAIRWFSYRALMLDEIVICNCCARGHNSLDQPRP